MNHTLATKLASALVLASSLAFVGGHSASADSISFTSNGRLAASLEVTCNSRSHLATAELTIAPEPGFEAGQSADYQIVIQDVTNGVTGQWRSFPWQGPYNVKTTSFVNNGITYINQGQKVPSYTFTGVAGHRYMVGGFVTWWNWGTRSWEGQSVLTDTAYSQYATYYGTSYYQTTNFCWT
jgi:hypothetical protein